MTNTTTLKPRYRFNHAANQLEPVAMPQNDTHLAPVEGDIIVNVWGWEQTNADFYRVTKAGKKFLTLQPLKAITTEHAPFAMYGTAQPDGLADASPTKASFKLRDDGEAMVKFDDGSGRIWDDQPVRVSWYA